MSGSIDRAAQVASAARVSYLGRLLEVLELVASEARRPLTVGDVSERLELPLSTASRLLGLLEQRGFVRRLSSSAFAEGPVLVQIALRALDRVGDRRQLEEALERLARACGESVSAGLLLRDQIVLVARRESEQQLRVVPRLGDLIPPHRTAMGKAILATLPAERRLEVLEAALPGRGEEVLVAIANELASVHECGYAVDDEQFMLGLRCRAAPIVSASGEAVGSISVAGPVARFTPDAASACLPTLLAEVGQLSLVYDRDQVEEASR